MLLSTLSMTPSRWRRLTNLLESVTLLALCTWFASGFLLQGTDIYNVSVIECLPYLFNAHNRYANIIWVLLASAVWCSYIRFVKPYPDKIAVFVCISLCLANYGVSALRVGGISVSQTSAVSLLMACTAGLLSARFCGTEHRALVVLTLFVAIQGCVAIGNSFFGVDTFYSGNLVRASGSYEGPFALYKVLVLCFPVAFVNVMESERKLRWVWCAILLIIGLALILTWYRAAIVSVALVTLWLLRCYNVRRQMMCLSIFSSIIIILSTFYIRVSDKAGASSSERSVLSRPVLWKKGFSEFSKSPIFGTGVGNLKIVVRSSRSAFSNPVNMKSPQNQYIFILAESGLVGATLFVVFEVATYRWLRVVHRREGYAIASAWGALSLCGITDTIFGVDATYYVPINFAVAMLAGCTLMSEGIVSKPNLAKGNTTPVLDLRSIT